MPASGRLRRGHLEPPRRAHPARPGHSVRDPAPWTAASPGSCHLCRRPLPSATVGPCTSGPLRPGEQGEVRACSSPGPRRGPRRPRAGTGGGERQECGFGLAATPTSCNHLQPLECTGETGEIYLFIAGICGQWVFLMKTICFCVFPENIIPRGKSYSHPFQQYSKNRVCIYVCTYTDSCICTSVGVHTDVYTDMRTCV